MDALKRARVDHVGKVLALPIRFHFFGSLAIVLMVAFAISLQIADRSSFANGELHRDVSERWGAPIQQAAPSVRYVTSGSIFTSLKPLPLDKQEIAVDAAMNYRKRGLVYFSGFEFSFKGTYGIVNAEERAIDAVFIFPIELQKNKVLLSNLQFLVNGEQSRIQLSEQADRLVWTGRVEKGQTVSFLIQYQGRGLDSFVYVLDPSLPARNVKLAIDVTGGSNFDYPPNVVSAVHPVVERDRASLGWEYASLESGVRMGVILPSEKSFDRIIVTMVKRSWACFVLFFAIVAALAIRHKREPRVYEAYLVASSFAFFFVLLAYLAAFMSFYAAYGLSLLIMGALLCLYLGRILGRQAVPYVAGALAASLLVPTAAVILEGYTGLIYTLEILAGLAGLMVLTTRPSFGSIAGELLGGSTPAIEGGTR